MTNEDQIRELVQNWAKAVREKDYDSILAYHHQDIIMYDVPPPFESRGIEAYRKTWDYFYAWPQQDASVFDIVELHIHAGDDVAFCFASMRCFGEDGNKAVYLPFRLTIGFKKIDGQWWFVHEHHSLPAS
jgi:ketosteroid isomerase-like protein